MKDLIALESTMSDSFIYGMFNSSGELQRRILKALKEGKALPESAIAEQMIQIQKTRISPLANDVIEAFRDGYLRLVYWDNDLEKMTKSIPFILHKSQKGVVASIFVSTFGKLSQDGEQLDLNMKSLYILMESAFIALNMQIRHLAFMRNTTVMRICNEIYTQMFLRILNRDYALSMDVSLHDKVSCAVSMFFLSKVWEMDNREIIRNTAVAATTEKNTMILFPLMDEYEAAEVGDLEGLFSFLKSITPRLESLSIRYFTERWITTYGPSSTLAIDYAPYLVFCIVNTVAGGFLVSQNTLSDIVKNAKEIRKFWPELTKLV